MIEIKKATIQTIDTLTIHGIPSLFRSKHLITKIIWLLLTLVSVGVSFYFVIITINKYLEFNVTTEVSFVDGNEFPFPTITFCNKNKFSTNTSYKYFLQVLLVSLK